MILIMFELKYYIISLKPICNIECRLELFLFIFCYYFPMPALKYLCRNKNCTFSFVINTSAYIQVLQHVRALPVAEVTPIEVYGVINAAY